eukprot:GHVU01031434.1.p1 GENE.GHVU01031434.1~~GHVU01031434.1.p1  ORF type:complete len:420 (+),score=63.23 GHVU01031434.1:62-1261(+)
MGPDGNAAESGSDPWRVPLPARSKQQPVERFSLSCAVDPSISPAEATRYLQVLHTFAEALRIAEHLYGYINSEVETLIGNKLRSLTKTPSDPASTHCCLSGDSMVGVCQSGRLLTNLKTLYNSMTRGRVAMLRFGPLLGCPIPTAPPLHRSSGPPDPHLALCLLVEPQTTKVAMPPDSALGLGLLIDFASPFNSINRIAAQLHLPVRTLQLYAQHLISWGLAVSVDPVLMSERYYVSPAAPLWRDAVTLMGAYREFNRRFGAVVNIGLLQLLALMDGSRSLAEVRVQCDNCLPPLSSVKEDEESEAHQRDKFVDIVAWLIAAELIYPVRSSFAFFPSTLVAAPPPSRCDCCDCCHRQHPTPHGHGRYQQPHGGGGGGGGRLLLPRNVAGRAGVPDPRGV